MPPPCGTCSRILGLPSSRSALGRRAMPIWPSARAPPPPSWSPGPARRGGGSSPSSSFTGPGRAPPLRSTGADESSERDETHRRLVGGVERSDARRHLVRYLPVSTPIAASELPRLRTWREVRRGAIPWWLIVVVAILVAYFVTRVYFIDRFPYFF